ncbi:MAG: DNA mismatch repair endonuclease MutL [Phycisphaeraceae bacterium]|nr:DNA mismatch repair endonuclease MutL [Phycisphaeraceae bacterium]
MPIRKLPPLVVNQIAAGEVIERPASVVKELVENSLDAGATRVEVQLEEGGCQLIRVSDDGRGIPAQELTLAVAPHATSKLSSAEELSAVATLGFRGEALASIASVSRLRLTSRAVVEGRIAEAAALLEASGEEVSPATPAATAPGTVVEVRDLFFNTPARRKFLRTGPTEFSYVADTLNRIALVHPQVAFTLIHNGRKNLDLPGPQAPGERCLEIIGRDLREGLLEFELVDDHPPGLPGSAAGNQGGLLPEDEREVPALPEKPVRIWGLAGQPSLARSSAKYQYVYVNGRPIRDRNLAHAVKEAYRGLTPPDRQPVVILMIDMDPHQVDVNVHPTKAEVRFREPSRMHGLVLTAIRRKLLASDLTPTAAVFGGGATGAFGGTGGLPTSGAAGGSADLGFERAPAPEPVAPQMNHFVEYFRRMDPIQRGLTFDQLRQEVGVAAGTQTPGPALPAKEAGAETAQGLAAEGAAHSTLRDAVWHPGQTMYPPAEPGAEAAGAIPGGAILQVHDSYLVTQDEQGIVIIDQHALHERVMFEELMHRVLGRNLESQRLLVPEVLPAAPRDLAALEEFKVLLTRVGIEAEPIGPRQIAIHAFPTFLFDRKVAPAEFLRDLLDKADDGQISLAGPQAEESALHQVLDMMACKAAVKAGDHLSNQELAALLQRRGEIERASNCPHGRPTTIRLTLRDLEKHFKRT